MTGSKPRLVVLSGAGISAESGLKTFRDGDGLWEGYAVEEVATPESWEASPETVLRFYNERRRQVRNAAPNAAHRGLASLEAHFDVTIITQNIDDLHERAGSSNVLHLHGQIFSKRSDRNPSLRETVREDMLPGALAPDGGRWRPDIVWFGEPVPMIETAARVVASADLFLVVGTSLVVYPAAGLIHAVAPGVPVWLVDKKLPQYQAGSNVHGIEMAATAGIAVFIEAILGSARSAEQ